MATTEIDINALEGTEKQKWLQLVEFSFQRRQIQIKLMESKNVNERADLIENDKQLLQRISKLLFELNLMETEETHITSI